MNVKLTKVLELSVAAIGLLIPLATDYINDKRMKREINFAVNEAITKQKAEMIDVEFEDEEDEKAE